MKAKAKPKGRPAIRKAKEKKAAAKGARAKKSAIAKPAKATKAKATPKEASAPARAPHVKTKKGEKIPAGKTASQLIDQRIADAGGWRGETLSHLRALILAADSAITEEWKWGVPVWSRNGILCTGEVYTQVVKLTFMIGAKLKDPQHLFNSSLEGATRRAIDIREGEAIDANAFQALIKAATAGNATPAKKR